MVAMQQGLVIFVILALVGCGESKQQVAEQRLSAQQAYDQANEAFASQDYQAAKTLYEQAVATGRLFGDLVGTARVKQAICLAKLDDLTAAHAALNELEQGAPNLDEIFAARSYVLAKQGKKKAAKVAWAKARRFNYSVKKISD